jgi:curved DNA-binding protein CbpA
VLGVQESATPEQIKRAYQRLVLQYHPDKVVDLAPELQALAEQRTKEINAAYTALKRN